jgi:hypothetical protein
MRRVQVQLSKSRLAPRCAIYKKEENTGTVLGSPDSQYSEKFREKQMKSIKTTLLLSQTGMESLNPLFSSKTSQKASPVKLGQGRASFYFHNSHCSLVTKCGRTGSPQNG